ncbi:MAG TPA: cyclase family protein [Thermoflexales bacterium]|nr:cyclase family protein [Thermoflexales bacterium]HQW34454.1 cyclase family protein [Thermoflexales bacterium]HQZ20957.1 cyclase family protein [Thermoflexales bacterium]HQZ98992.1 cyclase family protein [Thermoflexales bacterium]
MIYDITRPLKPDTAVFPGDTPVRFSTVLRLADGASCNLSAISMTAHAGTHVDGECHYDDASAGVDAVPLEVLIGLARVITLPDDMPVITRAWLQTHNLRGVKRLLLHTKNSAAPDDVFDVNFPYFEPDAAEYLGEIGVRLICTDCPSVDKSDAKTLIAHAGFFKHHVFIAENVQLTGIADGEYELVILPLKLAGRDGAPARAILRR